MPVRHMLFAISAVFIWALNLVLQKIAILEMSPYTFTVLRFFFSVPFLLFIPKPECSIKTMFILTMFINVLYFLFFAVGLKMGAGAGETSFVFQTSAVLSVIFSCLLGAQIPRINQILGITVSFFGVYLISSIHMSGESLSFPLLMIFVSAVFLGFGLALMQKQKLKTSLGLILWMNSLASLPMFFITLYFEGWSSFIQGTLEISLTSFLVLLYASVFASMVANYIWFKVIGLYGNARISVFMFLHPPFSCLLAYFLLGEELTFLHIVAGCIILSGIAINQFGRRPKLKEQVV